MTKVRDSLFKHQTITVHHTSDTSGSKSTSYSGRVLAVALIAEFVVIAIGIAIVGIMVVSFKRRW